MSNKEFIGWTAVKDVENNGNSWQYTQISFKIEDLERMKSFINHKGYVNLKLNRSKKGSEYLEIDTFGLNQRQEEPPQINQNPVQDDTATDMGIHQNELDENEPF